MNTDILPDFNALTLKDELQADVERDVAPLSPEERLHNLQTSVLAGPLGEWWGDLLAKDKDGGSAAELLQDVSTRARDSRYAAFRDELRQMRDSLTALRPWLDRGEADASSLPSPSKAEDDVLSLFRRRLDAMR